MLLMERSDALHFFPVFVLDEDIKELVFPNPAAAHRLIVKPQVCHLIDLAFDHC